ncbi:hypothetical protein AGRO_5346 [Agrobacterium sp. ATCC 31749]|nr:hypothetical protein AGRO_5346 [Agrobacterium sp. ATCC 31749]
MIDQSIKNAPFYVADLRWIIFSAAGRRYDRQEAREAA